jgi:hypothetical protein
MESSDRSKHAPRLSVLLAFEAPVGMVFRRGPTKLVRVFLWDRERDKFKPCQWFKGRIFAEQSDLSPDGRYMIYLAMGGVAWAIPATGGTWTAISRVPSLTAIALWGQGGGTRDGGGMFTSNHSYWLDAGWEGFPIRDTKELRRDFKRPADSRAERDGWVRTSGPRVRVRVFEKAIPKGWILRRTNRYPVKDRYELEQPEDGSKLLFPAWEWAEWDRNRLVWAEAGCLRAAKVGVHTLGTVRTLYDFNEQVIEDS